MDAERKGGKSDKKEERRGTRETDKINHPRIQM